MSETERMTYVCPNCNYTNVWTRDEILQRGAEVPIFPGNTLMTIVWYIHSITDHKIPSHLVARE